MTELDGQMLKGESKWRIRLDCVKMKERVELLNGDSKIDSKLNVGTAIRITLEVEVDVDLEVGV